MNDMFIRGSFGHFRSALPRVVRRPNKRPAAGFRSTRNGRNPDR